MGKANSKRAKYEKDCRIASKTQFSGYDDMTTKNTADIIRNNGYMPIPLLPGDKAIKIESWTLLAGQEEYDKLWQDAPDNANIGVYTGRNVIIADFDAKGDKPSIKVYEWLLETAPRTFAGSIIEQTPSGGIHATFRWCMNAISLPNGKGKTYMRFEIDGKQYDVELLTRGSQAVCPPSKTEKGVYKYLTEQTHINTRRDLLPVLPEIFRDANNRYLDDVMLAQRAAEQMAKLKHAGKKQVESFERLRPGEIDIVIDSCVKAYQKKACEGNRHPQALGLAMNVAGLPDSGRGDVERAIHDFYRGVGGEAPTASEINGIIKHGVDNPDHDPFIPMGEVIAYRKRKLVLNLEQRRAAANVKG